MIGGIIPAEAKIGNNKIELKFKLGERNLLRGSYVLLRTQSGSIQEET